MAAPATRAFVLFIATICVLYSPHAGAVPQRPQTAVKQVPAPTPSWMKIRVEEDLVTAEVQSTPLPQVLEEFAARTGIVFEINPHIVTPVTVSLQQVGIREAVDRLISGNNSICYYDTGESGRSRISFVRVLPRVDPSGTPSLRYIGTGSVTKTGDDSIDSPDQALKALAENQDADVRQKAIEILVTSRSEHAVPALLQAMADTVPEVRAAAIEGLAGLGARSSLAQILLALKDRHPGVRQSAIMAVALLGDSENVRDLRPMARDRDASVAAAAEAAIKKLSLGRP